LDVDIENWRIDCVSQAQPSLGAKLIIVVVGMGAENNKWTLATWKASWQLRGRLWDCVPELK